MIEDDLRREAIMLMIRSVATAYWYESGECPIVYESFSDWDEAIRSYEVSLGIRKIGE